MYTLQGGHIGSSCTTVRAMFFGDHFSVFAFKNCPVRAKVPEYFQTMDCSTKKKNVFFNISWKM